MMQPTLREARLREQNPPYPQPLATEPDRRTFNLYDEVDVRLIDTFPASDAVARY